MATVVKKTKVTREKGYLYFIDKSGDISRFKRGSKTKSKVKKVGLTREKGFLYFLDKEGNISKSKMKRK